jgi:hypothetical protein
MLRPHMSESEDRDLGFQIQFLLVDGVLTLGGSQVGRITTGRVTVPIRAFYRPHPPPGGYFFDLQDRGVLPDEAIVETMGNVDVSALAKQLTLPPAWKVIPEELLEDLQLDARLIFESVSADDEYVKNEPGDLEEARKRYQGTWRLTCQFGLGFSVELGAVEISLDRREFELSTTHVRLQEAT